MLHVVFQRMESNTHISDTNEEPVAEEKDFIGQMLEKLVSSCMDDVVMHNEQELDGPVLHGNFGECKEVNEIDIPAGDYGWCINCRQPAIMLSEMHDPVCSHQCATYFAEVC